MVVYTFFFSYRFVGWSFSVLDLKALEDTKLISNFRKNCLEEFFLKEIQLVVPGWSWGWGWVVGRKTALQDKTSWWMRWDKPEGLRNKAQVFFLLCLINEFSVLDPLLCIIGKHQKRNSLSSLPAFCYSRFSLSCNQHRYISSWSRWTQVKTGPLPPGITFLELCNCLPA